MGDFILNPGKHECFFVDRLADLVPSAPGTWRLDNHKGTLFMDGRRLRVTPDSADPEVGSVSVLTHSGLTACKVPVTLAKPDGVHGHYFSGKIEGTDDELFLMKYRDKLKTEGVLVQRYRKGSEHWPSRPSDPDNIKYPGNVVVLERVNRYIKSDDFDAVIPTQDDEGGGYVP